MLSVQDLKPWQRYLYDIGYTWLTFDDPDLACVYEAVMVQWTMRSTALVKIEDATAWCVFEFGIDEDLVRLSIDELISRGALIGRYLPDGLYIGPDGMSHGQQY